MNSVCKDLQCFVLRDEVDELHTILDFGVRLYGGSELSKKPLKMLATDANNGKKSNPIRICL